MESLVAKHIDQRSGARCCAAMARALRLLLLTAGMMMATMVAAGPASAETLQQRWVGDLPIMQGMSIEPQLGFAFDSPEGRIVQIFATGPSETGPVIRYYNEALSGLGWDGRDGQWKRNDEALVISQVEMASGTLWRIRLSPL